MYPGILTSMISWCGPNCAGGQTEETHSDDGGGGGLGNSEEVNPEEWENSKEASPEEQDTPRKSTPRSRKLLGGQS
jgi:hypothetical protein